MRFPLALRGLAVAGALVAVLLLANPASAFTTKDLDVASHDGVILKARLYEPAAGTGPHPGILIAHGWGEDHLDNSVVRVAERLADEGYIVLTWTARGFGESGGVITLNGQAEIDDAKAMVDLLAGVPGIQMDNVTAKDPRFGMTGRSYGGGIQLLLAAQDKRVDSLVPVITWNDLEQSLGPNDVIKRGWVTLLLASGQAEGHGIHLGAEEPSPNADGPHDDLAKWYAEAMANNGFTDEIEAELAARSYVPGSIQVPTFLLQGWPDTLFGPDQAIATYQDIAANNVPARLWIGDMGHGGFDVYDGPYYGRADAAIDAWFNTTLRGDPADWTYPIERTRSDGSQVGEFRWPPAGTSPQRFHLGEGSLSYVPVAAGSTDLVAVAEGGNCIDVPQFQAQTDPACPASDPATAARWLSDPLEGDHELTGAPLLELTYETTQLTDTRVFATLLDVDPAGEAVPILRQVTPMRTAGAASVRVQLQTITHTFPSGHRLGLQLATTDFAHNPSREPGVVTILSGPDGLSSLTVPWLGADDWGDQEAPTATVSSSGPSDDCVPGDVCAGESRRLISVHAIDNWYVDDITLDAGNFRVEPLLLSFTNGANENDTGQDFPQEIRSPVVDADFLVTEDAAGDYTVTVTLRDGAGNVANVTSVFTSNFVPVVPMTEEVKQSPMAAPVLAIVAVALVVARTRRS